MRLNDLPLCVSMDTCRPPLYRGQRITSSIDPIFHPASGGFGDLNSDPWACRASTFAHIAIAPAHSVCFEFFTSHPPDADQMTLSLQNSVRTTTKCTEIHSKIKLNERPQAPCQVMASHLCQAGHCEEPQECKAAIIVGLGSNRQNPGRREDVEHFYRGCQGRRASFLVSLKCVKKQILDVSQEEPDANSSKSRRLDAVST